MKRFVFLVAGVLLAMLMAAPALAADPVVPSDGPVHIVIDGNVTLATGEHAAVLVVVQGDALVQGTADSVTVVGGTATLHGTVQTLTVIDGRADLMAGSRVAGDVIELNATIERAEGATIGGTIRPLAENLVGFGLFLGTAAILIWIGAALALLLAGLALAAFASRQVRAAEAVITHEPVKALLVGLAMIFIPPLGIVLLAVTIVGLPLALSLLFMVWPVLAFVGYLVGAIWIGEWVLRRSGRPEDERPYLAAFVGLLIAAVLGIIPVISAVISIFGLGAVTVAGWRTLIGPPGRGMPVSPQAAPIAG